LAAKASKTALSYSAFISHAKADAKKAEAIAEGLEKRGFKCWIAPRDVKAGRAYGDEIIRGIESAKAFVLVLSKASNDSAFVAREVERAASKKKPIFAVRVADVHPGPALELFISGTQWIDAFPGRLAPHIDRVADMLAEEAGADPMPRPDAGSAKPKRQWLWPAGAATSVALVVAAGAMFWPAGDTVSTSDPALMTKPVWVDQSPSQANEQVAGVQEKEDTPHRVASADPAGQPPGAAWSPSGAASVELEMWNAVKDTGNADALEAYLERFGDGLFATVARAKLEALRAAEKEAPNDPDAQYCNNGSGAPAIAACDRAIYSGRFNGAILADLYDGRGSLHLLSGDLSRAQSDFERAIQLDPGNYRFFWNRAELFRQQGDRARAVADFARALSLGPSDDDRLKMQASLQAMGAAAEIQDDPSVITTPSWGNPGEESAAASTPALNFPADAMPASPPIATIPAFPASPAPMPAR
jgi:hypothetical protein